VYSADSRIVELFEHRDKDDPRAEISLLALSPGQPSTGSDAFDFLTIEKIGDGELQRTSSSTTTPTVNSRFLPASSISSCSPRAGSATMGSLN
jgi:hypothetical protein